jgi:phosphoribosylformylglycinamidine cyclo-ligase
LPEQHAERVIEISKDFKIEAQVVGRVEEGGKKLSISSSYGEFTYV